ncbi:MAG: hypothetical protein AUG49_04385 [Catenulispora sp. 13_1_20CM_3_70_7]|nr:MAG: hypothetical protein AUG49_04385 [Catenulispora sp. 13_1_20CM_3_70_7]
MYLGAMLGAVSLAVASELLADLVGGVALLDGRAEDGLDNGQGVGCLAFEGASKELQVGGVGVGVDADQAALAGQAGQ